MDDELKPAAELANLIRTPFRVAYDEYVRARRCLAIEPAM